MSEKKKHISYFQSIRDRDPAARSWLHILLCYPGVRAMINFRIAHFIYCKLHLHLLAEYIMYRVRCKYNVDIHPAATIGKRLFMDHAASIVIGETTIIGDDCTLYQCVTLGGNGKQKNKRHPTLGNNVLVGSGAKILGNVVIGDNVKVGANTVVLHDVETDKTIVGVKGHVVERINGDDVIIHDIDPLIDDMGLDQIK